MTPTKSFRCLGALMLLWCCSISTVFSKEPMRYIYPPPESGADVRMNYYWELLHAALEETSPKWGAYTVGTGSKVLNAARAELQLMASNEITVMARTSSIDREKSLLTVLVPLDKGLTGYRLFLTNKATQNRLNAVRTLNELKGFSIGQGVNWIDSDILRNAGLTVVTAPNYDNLFSMLGANRFDLFSRGVNEIGLEYVVGKVNNPELVVEKNLLLYYPLPRYFFFSRTVEGERLAKRVEDGLRLLMKNGKFEKRYQEFKRSILVDMAVAGRRVIRISNPYLSAATPLADKDMWDTGQSTDASSIGVRSWLTKVCSCKPHSKLCWRSRQYLQLALCQRVDIRACSAPNCSP